MSATFLEAAAKDPVLLHQVAAAVEGVVGASAASTVAGAQALVGRAAEDRAFRAQLASAVGDVATRNGYTFSAEQAPASADDALPALEAAAALKLGSHKDNPTQTPISQPIALLFVAAQLIFLPPMLETPAAAATGDGVEGHG